MNPFTSTKAKREAIAREVEETAALYGATVSRGEYDKSDEINLTVALGPYRCMIWLYRGRGDGFMGNWYTDHEDREAEYPADFAASINGTRNEFHRRKATLFADDLGGFLCLLGRGLECLQAELTEHA